MTDKVVRLDGRVVTVNAIAPGQIETEMSSVLSAAQHEAITNSILLGRLGVPDDLRTRSASVPQRRLAT
jgi:3-oxoacyl-[acyl-carrier protein] reductase